MVLFRSGWPRSASRRSSRTPTNTPTPSNTPTATFTPTNTPTATHTPSGVDRPLISQVFYDTPGTDSDEEWIEIYYPNGSRVDISGYRLGDQETQGGNKEMYQFPSGATIGAGQRIVVARSATGFFAFCGLNPDYEFTNGGPNVPDMTPNSGYAGGSVALSNSGNEVLLLDGTDSVVDVVTYENGTYASVVAHPGVSTGPLDRA